MHGLADVTLIFMRTDRAHDDRCVLRRCAEPAQNSMGEQRASAGMIEAADDVTNVMEIGGNCGELLLATVETHPLQNIARDVRHQADMAEAVLGVANRRQITICVPDECLNFRIGFHCVQADGRFPAARLTVARRSERIHVIALSNARSRSPTAGYGNFRWFGHAHFAWWNAKSTSCGSIGRIAGRRRCAPAGRAQKGEAGTFYERVSCNAAPV